MNKSSSKLVSFRTVLPKKCVYIRVMLPYHKTGNQETFFKRFDNTRCAIYQKDIRPTISSVPWPLLETTGPIFFRVQN